MDNLMRVLQLGNKKFLLNKNQSYRKVLPFVMVARLLEGIGHERGTEDKQ